MEKHFKKYEIITGWFAFLVALITYGFTVEPTLSYWDCGEYIATSAKLQIGHPPGAPFFQMMGAFFAMFAPEPDKVALLVNWMSVLSSAFTILFLFFIITNLTKKLALRSGQPLDLPKIITILGSGLVGALAYTFSDSFWFNAVEAEVYAMAMLFMAAMFWLGIKWTDNLHQPRGDKWLILIALVVGLSFGVHFMALLTIPAIGMLYFFNSHHKKNIKNFLLANVISVGVLLLIFKLILPYTLAYFGYLEVFFVNSIGLPFNSGTIIAGISIILAFYFTLRYTYRHQKTHLQTIALCVLFVLIGFSTWVMIPIRANAHTVINENSPTDARLLLAYYKLEQYAETHLFYGPMFSDKYAGLDEENPYMNDKPKYERDYKQNKYVIVNAFENARMRPNSEHEGILPRMWNAQHATNYMAIAGLLDFSIKPEYFSNDDLRQGVAEFKQRLQQGQISLEEYDLFLSRFKDYIDVKKPSFWQNMQYLFSYQMNYMYWRYFMWNFVGRQNDIQGRKDGNGNWLSGINFIDSWRLGSQEHLPSDVLNNKARNTYFFLPLLLGIIGLFYMLSKSERQTWVVFVLFMFTGLALKVYLNEKPFEPRERDYALVGSFFTFAIWIGVGVYAIFEFLRKAVANNIAAPLSVLATLLAVPVIMANQNWDDHSRANRYTARAVAKAYLDSVKKDVGALLFTIGDNDTFGVWYAQEIENYRTDVRAINTALLSTDWYIDQMKRKAHESEPIPSQLTHDKYAYGVRDVVYYNPLTENTWNIKDFMNWIESDDPKTQMTFKNKQRVHYYPTHKVRIPVNKENVLKSGIVKPEDADLIVDYIDIELPKSGIEKNRMLMLDIMANNDWKRPIYFTGGSLSPEEYIWMKDYLQLDGFAYKLVPIKTPIDKKSPLDMGRIDTELMFEIVTRLDWGNMESPEIYHDPETRKNGMILRGNLARLKEALLKEGKTEKAKKVIDLAMTKIPFEYFGYYFSLEPFIEGYYQTNQPEKARELFLKIAQKYQEELSYYIHLPLEQRYENFSEIQYTAQRYGSLLAIAVKNKDTDFAQNQELVLKKYLTNFIDEIDDRKSLMDELNEQNNVEDSL